MYTILVVDDEEIIRNGICKKIARFFPKLNIAPAQENAIEALHYIQNNEVDIIFTDIKMPLVNGLEFIERALQYNKLLKFVILSGYQNFEFAKKAIGLGVKDYLLKPIDNEEMKNIIESLIVELDKQKKVDKSQIVIGNNAQEGIFSKTSKYISELVNIEASLDTMELLTDLNEQNINFDRHYSVALSVEVNNIKEIETFNTISGLYILQYAICNIIDEVFANYNCVSSVKDKTDNNFIVILNTDTPITHYYIVQKASMLGKVLNNIYGLMVKIGIGETVESAEDFCKSYYQAYRAMLQCNMYEDKQISTYSETIENNNSNKIKLLSGFQKDLLESYIKTQNIEKIEESLAQIFTDLREEKFENIKIIGYEFYFLIIKLLKENDKDMEVAYTMFEKLEQVVRLNNKGDIQKWFKEQFIEICKIFENSKKCYGKTLVEEVEAYVEKNYSKEISLGSIASKFYINSSYLSQVFKREKNIKFIDYITSIRLNKAKYLLENTDMKANEISEAIGYSDSRYFREVFVKHVKETPTQYRKNKKIC